MGNRATGVKVGAFLSTGTAVGGVALIVVSGPIGVLAGGVLLSAGISGGVNTA